MVGCSEPSHIAQVSSCPKQASYRSSTSVGPIPFPPSLQASFHLYFWTTSLLLPSYIAFQVATTKVSGCGAKHGGAGEHSAAEAGKVQDRAAEAGGQDLGQGRCLVSHLFPLLSPMFPGFWWTNIGSSRLLPIWLANLQTQALSTTSPCGRRTGRTLGST